MAQVLAAVLPGWAQPTIVVNETFIVVFVVVDQLLCLACTVWTPGHGATAPMSARRLATSVTFGFLNCKTFVLMLLLHARGLEINVAVWVVDGAPQLPRPQRVVFGRIVGTLPQRTAVRRDPVSRTLSLWRGGALPGVLGIAPRVAALVSRVGMHWAALFYQQHRLAHLPHVYEAAHKAHHWLHDSCAFDGACGSRTARRRPVLEVHFGR